MGSIFSFLHRPPPSRQSNQTWGEGSMNGPLFAKAEPHGDKEPNCLRGGRALCLRGSSHGKHTDIAS